MNQYRFANQVVLSTLQFIFNFKKLTIEIGHFVLSYGKNDKQKLKEAENHLPDNAHNAS